MIEKERSKMSDFELKLLEWIRSNDDYEAALEYLEELLFNPQKFQEALEALSAPQEI
jgi:hypothetical protein